MAAKRHTRNAPEVLEAIVTIYDQQVYLYADEASGGKLKTDSLENLALMARGLISTVKDAKLVGTTGEDLEVLRRAIMDDAAIYAIAREIVLSRETKGKP